MEKMSPRKSWLKKNLKIRELTKNEKVLLTLLSAVILIWGSNRFIITPQAEKLELLKEERGKYQEKIDEMNSILRSEEYINKEWDVLHKERESIVSKYFPTIDQAQIIYLLNDLIQHEDVSVVDLNFNRPSFEDIGEFQVKNMDISIPYNGGYDGVVGIINEIRKSPRKILVDNLSMDRNPEGILNGNMSLKIYSLEGIAETDNNIVYIDTTSNGTKITPFHEYDDYTPLKEEPVDEYVDDNENIDSGKDMDIEDIPTKQYIEEILLDFESGNNYFLPSQPLVKGNIIQSNNAKSKKYSLRFEYDILAVEDENRAYIDISRNNITLKYPPNTIGMWIYSYDYSPVTLGIGFKGQMGEEEFLPLTEGIGWTGWKYIESTPPTDLSLYPLKLDKIYLEMPKNREDFGVILMDKLEAIYPRNLDEEGSDKSMPDYIFHVVEKGDTIEGISMMHYGTSNYKNEILRLNEMKYGDMLISGRVLVLKKR